MLLMRYDTGFGIYKTISLKYLTKSKTPTGFRRIPDPVVDLTSHFFRINCSDLSL